MRFFHAGRKARIFVGERRHLAAQGRVLLAQRLRQLGQLPDLSQQLLEFGNHGGTIVAPMNFRQYIQGVVAESSYIALV